MTDTARDLDPGPDTLRLVVPSHTSYLHLVTNLARNSALTAELSEADADKLALATDEAVTNVIEHAYHGLPSRSIEIVVKLRPGGVELHIIHDGDPIDEASLRTSFDLKESVKGRKRGGLGVFLMRRLVDRVDFRPTADRRNECCLVKERAAPGEARAEDVRGPGRT